MTKMGNIAADVVKRKAEKEKKKLKTEPLKPLIDFISSVCLSIFNFCLFLGARYHMQFFLIYNGVGIAENFFFT